MTFDTRQASNNLSRFKEENTGVGASEKGVGSPTRQRTQAFLGLGQSAARLTEQGMDSSIEEMESSFSRRRDRRTASVETNHFADMAAWVQGIEEEASENKPQDNYDPLKLSEDLYGKKGVQAGKVAPQSYFDNPIEGEGIRGNSRKAGDIDPAVQDEIARKIVETGSALDMSDYEIAYTLATVRYESGFNPDAAAKSTSARGLGQFIDKTGKAYGLTKDNQWDVDSQVQAVLEHTADNFKMAEKKGYGNEYVYAFHHDGPSLAYGGLNKSKKHIMPFVPKYLELIKTYRGEE